MAFSREELQFVRESISKGIRTDLRNPQDCRKIEFQILENPQADGSLRITRGHTKVKVSFQFKESEDGLLELKLIKEKEGLGDLEVSVIPLSIKRQVEDWLKKFKVGLRVDFEIENDDGNIYETFILGLRELLKEVEIPDILDLDRTVKSGLLIQEMRVVCLFGSVVVVDPLKVEEASCDSSFVFVGDKGRLRNIWMNKCGEVDFNQLRSIFHS